LLVINEQDRNLLRKSLEIHLIGNVLDSNVDIYFWVLILEYSGNVFGTLDGWHTEMTALPNNQHQANGIAHDPSLISGHAP
jgi:hypothetical protein